ncbi:MAG: S9 family peptidase [Bacteroidetes bacterium]|nr:MAG: S9 family peptidase [Bacteroidota bacterium]
MKKLFLSLSLLSVVLIHAQLKYPEANKSDVIDMHNGIKVPDPYRWMEDDNSDMTKQWVEAENKVTFSYLATIPFRDKVRKRLEELWNYPKYSSPFKQGEYYYYFKNDGLQNQSVLYRQKGLGGTPELFLDPNTLSKEGIAAIGSLEFTKNGKYLAYSVAVAGSDWQEIYLMEATTRKKMTDKIEWTKFGGVSWNGEDGFYYSGYDKPDEASKMSKQNQFHKVFYHKLGTPQSEDKLVFEDRNHPLRYHRVRLTEDGRFLILNISEGTSGVELRYMDMKDAAQKDFKMLVPGFKTQAGVIDNIGGNLLLRTNDNAPNYKVVLVDPKNPASSNWKTVIPQAEFALQGVGTGGGFLFANYLKDASTKVYQYSYDGNFIRDIELPGIGTASGFDGEKEDREFFYSYNSFNTPPAIYRYDIKTGKSSLFRKTKVNMNTDQFITEQVFVNSKDGTRVPVFLTYKKGLEMNGRNPLLLYGYGGFNIPMTPSFSISNAFFMEQGGIYAVVNLRGGSEYGEKWHKDGMLDKKQNVFDDFIAAAEWLIKNRYTNSKKLAIRGGSNGGLLVGAAMTQRPELFKVALPAVGVMDMLRFHKFTVGWGWTVEYGNADSASQFPFIYKYSPYHNLKPGTSYPATLVTTADHDDRVVPAHSFKFAARLQEYNVGSNPVLIRVETNAGHGAGKPTSKQIDEAADTWSFVMQNLGMQFQDNPGDVAADRGKTESPSSKTDPSSKAQNSPKGGEPSPIQKAIEARSGKGEKPVPPKKAF